VNDVTALSFYCLV